MLTNKVQVFAIIELICANFGDCLFHLLSALQLLEKHVPQLCTYLSSSLLSSLVLMILVDMAMSRPAAVVSQLTTIQAAVETQPMFMYQVAQIMGAVGTLNKVSLSREQIFLILAHIMIPILPKLEFDLSSKPLKLLCLNRTEFLKINPKTLQKLCLWWVFFVFRRKRSVPWHTWCPICPILTSLCCPVCCRRWEPLGWPGLIYFRSIWIRSASWAAQAQVQ